MPARSEGSVSLPLNNTIAVTLSTIALLSAFFNKSPESNNSHADLSAETTHVLPRPASDLGRLATQTNYYLWQHYKPLSKVQSINDANSIDTPDWSCDMDAEGSNPGGNYTQVSGAFGIETSTWQALPSEGFNLAAGYLVPGDAPPEVQNRAALFLYAANGYHYKGTWNNYCTEEGLIK